MRRGVAVVGRKDWRVCAFLHVMLSDAIYVNVCVCVRVRVWRVRACVRACVPVYVCVCVHARCRLTCM